jgi:hypothetical protein
MSAFERRVRATACTICDSVVALLYAFSSVLEGNTAKVR